MYFLHILLFFLRLFDFITYQRRTPKLLDIFIANFIVLKIWFLRVSFPLAAYLDSISLLIKHLSQKFAKW